MVFVLRINLLSPSSRSYRTLTDGRWKSWTKSDLVVRRSIIVIYKKCECWRVLLTRRVSDFHFRIQSLSSFSWCLEVLSGCHKVFKENLTYWWTLVQYCPSFGTLEILYWFGMGSVFIELSWLSKSIQSTRVVQSPKLNWSTGSGFDSQFLY